VANGLVQEMELLTYVKAHRHESSHNTSPQGGFSGYLDFFLLAWI
jgi:hypothetical protein